MNLTKNKKTEVKQFLKEMKANRTNQSSNKHSIPQQPKRSNSINALHSQAETKPYESMSSNYIQDVRNPQSQISKMNMLNQQSSSRSQYGSQSNVYQSQNDLNMSQFRVYNNFSQGPYIHYNEKRVSQASNYIHPPAPYNMHVYPQPNYQNSNPFPRKELPVLKRSSQSQIYHGDYFQNNYSDNKHHQSNFIINDNNPYMNNSNNYYAPYQSNQINQDLSPPFGMHLNSHGNRITDKTSHYQNNPNQYIVTLPKNNCTNSPSENSYLYSQKNSEEERSTKNYHKPADEHTNNKKRKQHSKSLIDQSKSDYLHNFSNFSQIEIMQPISQTSDGHQGSQTFNNNIIYCQQNKHSPKASIVQNQNTRKRREKQKINQDLIKSEVLEVEKFVQKTKKKQFNFISKGFQVVIQPERLNLNKDESFETKIKKRKNIFCNEIQSNFREGMTKIRQVLPTVQNFVQACRRQLLWIQKERERFQISNNLHSQMDMRS